MFFIFQFVGMVYNTDCFVYIKESLHPCDKPDLIMKHFFFFFEHQSLLPFLSC